jgi:hypothetical protein
MISSHKQLFQEQTAESRVTVTGQLVTISTMGQTPSQIGLSEIGYVAGQFEEEQNTRHAMRHNHICRLQFYELGATTLFSEQKKVTSSLRHCLHTPTGEAQHEKDA